MFWSRHVHKFTILQLGLHEKGRGGQPLGDVGIVLLARCSEYFCDLWTCNWSDTASRGYIVLTLASQTRLVHLQCVNNFVFHSILLQKRQGGLLFVYKGLLKIASISDFSRRACYIRHMP